MSKFMLTTFDNPFSPFDQFETWLKKDIESGHDTCGLLATESATSNVFSDSENDELTLQAMDRICQQFPMIYKKVEKNSYTP